jgi:hypothetical protein
MTDGLFPEPERTALPAAGADDLSADQRRTARRRDLLARGMHPLAGTPLHPDAPRVTEPGQPGDGPRCGTCRFLRKRNEWWKCDLIPFTSGAGTDARRWWPGCTKWEPRTRDDLRVRVDDRG